MEAYSSSEGQEGKNTRLMSASITSKKEVCVKKAHDLFDRISGLAEKDCLWQRKFDFR